MTERARRWVFTLNNYTDSELEEVDKFAEKYIVFGFEKGENETPHLQGYCEFDNAIGLKRVKKLLSRAHWEKARGDWKSNFKYCTKDGNWCEKGTRPLGQGYRSDLHELAKLIKEDKPLSLISELHPVEFIKYGRGIKELALMNKPPKWRDVEVVVFWGKTGTGKTRTAMAEDSVYKLNTNNNGTLWFDGYDGEKTLVLDDFYGWIKYGELLTLLDGYPYRCQVKGSSVWARWTKVIITSNKRYEDWYMDRDISALKRRISKIGEFL